MRFIVMFVTAVCVLFVIYFHFQRMKTFRTVIENVQLGFVQYNRGDNSSIAKLFKT